MFQDLLEEKAKLCVGKATSISPLHGDEETEGGVCCEMQRRGALYDEREMERVCGERETEGGVWVRGREVRCQRESEECGVV